MFQACLSTCTFQFPLKQSGAETYLSRVPLAIPATSIIRPQDVTSVNVQPHPTGRTTYPSCLPTLPPASSSTSPVIPIPIEYFQDFDENRSIDSRSSPGGEPLGYEEKANIIVLFCSFTIPKNPRNYRGT